MDVRVCVGTDVSVVFGFRVSSEAVEDKLDSEEVLMMM